MKAYLRAFVNWHQSNWTRLLLIAVFAYNNIRNLSIGYTPFKLNCEFHPRVLLKEDVDPYFKLHLANKLADKLKELIEICCQNLLYIQELQKEHTIKK